MHRGTRNRFMSEDLIANTMLTVWMWSVALAMSTVFFLIHVLLQKANLVEPPIEDEVAPAVPAVAPAAAPVTVVDATEMPKEESEA